MPDTDIIRIDSSKISLPSAKTKAAEFIAKKMDVVFSALGPVADRAMFAASAVIAANELPVGASEVAVAKAVFGAAYLQLPFGSHLGFAYMLPFRNRKASEQAGREIHDVTLCIGYQGYQELALRANYISDIHADYVTNDEEFKFWKDETGPRLNHVPSGDRNGHRGNIVAAYCLYHTTSGGRGIRYVSRNEINAVDKNKDVWISNYAAMAMKTAIRRAAKEWRKTPQLAYAVRVDEQSDRDELPDAPPIINAELAGELTEEPKPAWTPPTE